ncbi:MAG: glycosyltransferase family 4 protein [Acidobacteria bacterium]|nr:glycosyltransferase family 4 protein [Acidobacteriota bacterium]
MSDVDPIHRVTIISPYALSVFGGVQEQALAMSRELSRRGLEVQVVAPDASDESVVDTPARLERLGPLVSVRANGSRAPLTLSARASREAFARILAFAPEVVHWHEPFAPRLGWRTLRAHRVAAVGTFHRSGTGPALTWSAPLLRRWARHLDVCVAVSEQAAHTARQSCGVSPTILFNGFETERFTQFAREPQQRVTVLVVGRLEERKGVSTAITAVREHNAHATIPWRLVIAGDGPERANLERLAAADAAIEFLGAVSDENKRQWYRRADVVVAPATHGESFGLVLLEAMAAETRVVASDIAGYRDAVGSHAVLFPRANSRELEVAIDQALASRDAITLGRAREHAESWSMRHLMDEYLILYERARAIYGAGVA